MSAFAVIAMAVLVPTVLASTEPPEEIARKIQRRLASSDCAAFLVGRAGESIAALKEHHLLDLATLPGDSPVEDAEALLRASVSRGTRTGNKTYPFRRWPADFPVRRLIEELERVLRTQAGRPQVSTPFYLAIVGLGDLAGEFPVLVELVDEALERIRGDRTKEEIVAKMQLRFGLYDPMADALDRADAWERWLALRFPWLRGRTDVRFFDMTIPEMTAPWRGRELGLVLVRNSLRDQLMTRGWPLLLTVHDQMVSGGLLGTDSEAASRLGEPWCFANEVPPAYEQQLWNPEGFLRKLGGFSGSDDQDEDVLFMRK